MNLSRRAENNLTIRKLSIRFYPLFIRLGDRLWEAERQTAVSFLLTNARLPSN
ncbi:hypothetical protein HMPREF9141_0695 [Prevotella multiformis DSM 16608]|uniref:Uncharacterized protein n=1 Tax=Prevotella multiformis DSM 16608 TaxID=888743 RepID=F0F529_9BACT|nr:hypothetical protein HMPREF9141_0695 [Prevotella multiformis DSM 16608]